MDYSVLNDSISPVKEIGEELTEEGEGKNVEEVMGRFENWALMDRIGSKFGAR